MKGALQVVKIAGIPVHVHWTFGLILLWVVYYSLSSGLSIISTLIALGVISLLFVCVVMHEYGHALTARRFGVLTKDILLLPIGGLARLSHIPENPWKEIAIALAGPAVNLVIATLILVPMALGAGADINVFSESFWSWEGEQPLLLLIAKINLILMLFNMVPSFPMDGGRVLRAVMCLFTDRVPATRMATTLGQLFGLLLICAFIYELISGKPLIVAGVTLSGVITAIIGGFVILAARAEMRQTIVKQRLKDTRVGHVMDRTFTMMDSGSTLSQIHMSGQDRFDFLVGSNGQIEGVLFAEAIQRGLEAGNWDLTVGEIMSDRYEVVPSDITLLKAFELFRKEGYRIVPVLEHGVIAGVLTRRHLAGVIEGEEL